MELIYKKVQINDKQIAALIDCGSAISLIDESIVNELGLVIYDYNGPIVRAVNGTQVCIEGEVNVDIKIIIDGIMKSTPIKLVVVHDFDFDLLLGMDFHRKARILIDCSNEKLLFSNDFQANLIKCNCSDQCICFANSIQLSSKVMLKPREKVYVRVVTSAKKLNNNFSAIIQTDAKFFSKSKLYVKQTKVHFVNSRAYLLLKNLSEQPKVINRGTIIANYKPL